VYLIVILRVCTSGMLLSLDEYCEQVAGSGWAYRDWYYEVVRTRHQTTN